MADVFMIDWWDGWFLSPNFEREGKIEIHRGVNRLILQTLARSRSPGCISGMQPPGPDARPTITTVATQAGVSISTVSRALHNNPLVSAKTRAEIHKIAASIGYVPNPYISTLMSHLRCSKPIPYQASIALLDSMETADSWKKFIVQKQFHEGAVEQATKLGYKLERFWVFAPGLSRTSLTRMMVSRGIRGILIPPFRDYSSTGADIPLELGEFACVTVGCKVQEPSFHFATNDQYATGMLAHDRLLDLGYNRVGLAIPHYVESIVEQRFSAGFRNALERRARTSPRASVFRYQREQGSKPFLEWFHSFKPDAICTIFTEVCEWLKKDRIKVPGDVALATLDWNKDLRDWSGVDQESRRVGAAAIDIVVQLLQRNELGPPPHPFGLNIEGTWMDGKTAPRKIPVKG